MIAVLQSLKTSIDETELANSKEVVALQGRGNLLQMQVRDTHTQGIAIAPPTLVLAFPG